MGLTARYRGWQTERYRTVTVSSHQVVQGKRSHQSTGVTDLQRSVKWVILVLLGTYRTAAEPAFEPTERSNSIFSDSE